LDDEVDLREGGREGGREGRREGVMTGARNRIREEASGRCRKEGGREGRREGGGEDLANIQALFGDTGGDKDVIDPRLKVLNRLLLSALVQAFAAALTRGLG
jgi:hypothetical protein